MRSRIRMQASTELTLLTFPSNRNPSKHLSFVFFDEFGSTNAPIPLHCGDAAKGERK